MTLFQLHWNQASKYDWNFQLKEPQRLTLKSHSKPHKCPAALTFTSLLKQLKISMKLFASGKSQTFCHCFVLNRTHRNASTYSYIIRIIRIYSCIEIIIIKRKTWIVKLLIRSPFIHEFSGRVSLWHIGGRRRMIRIVNRNDKTGMQYH